MNWFGNIKKWYTAGYWTKEMVTDAYLKNKITLEEKDKILKGATNEL